MANTSAAALGGTERSRRIRAQTRCPQDVVELAGKFHRKWDTELGAKRPRSPTGMLLSWQAISSFGFHLDLVDGDALGRGGWSCWSRWLTN